MRQVNKVGIDLIKGFEGLKLKPYLDVVGIATVGYGTIKYPNGPSVAVTDPVITEVQAEEYLQFEVQEKARKVEQFVTVPINDNQFAALVSLAYNVGVSAISKSTLLKRLNAGDVSGAADEFLRWNKAGGKVVGGLTRRRQAERSLFLQSVPPSNQLSSGPTEAEINEKLKNIEDDIL